VSDRTRATCTSDLGKKCPTPTTTVHARHFLLFFYFLLLWADAICSHLYHARCLPGNDGCNRHSQPLCRSVIGVQPDRLISFCMSEKFHSRHCNHASRSLLFQESSGGMGCRRFVSKLAFHHAHHTICPKYTTAQLFSMLTTPPPAQPPPPHPPPQASSCQRVPSPGRGR